MLSKLRYVGVCHPLKRKDVCNLRSSKRIVFFAVIASFLVSAFRPWLNEVHYIGPNNVPWMKSPMTFCDNVTSMECLNHITAYGVLNAIKHSDIVIRIIVNSNRMILSSVIILTKRSTLYRTKQCALVFTPIRTQIPVFRLWLYIWSFDNISAICHNNNSEYTYYSEADFVIILINFTSVSEQHFKFFPKVSSCYTIQEKVDAIVHEKYCFCKIK
jgi:hypothetical protein